MNVGIFSLLWAKNDFSAACVRTFGLIHSFLKNNCNIFYFSPAKESKIEKSDLKQYSQLKLLNVTPDNMDSVYYAFKKIKGQLDIAIFDTFIAEEKFSHFVHRRYPNCLKVLDLQDYHSLRMRRSEIIQADSLNLSLQNLPNILKIFPHPQENDYFNRELASMLRSDVVLSCSDYELLKLREEFKINQSELITFFYGLNKDSQYNEAFMNFEQRKHFVWIGNHSHPPNFDSLNVLVKEVWPQIRQQLPEAELHIYGSNFRKEFSQLDSLKQGIKSRGLMQNIEYLKKYRVLLAPLRFGAGIKGKIVDSWDNFLPVVTTPIGAEGLFQESAQEDIYTEIIKNKQFYKDKLSKVCQQDIDKENLIKKYYKYNESDQKELAKQLTFGGSFLNYTIQEFCNNSVKIYQDKEQWLKSVKSGRDILAKRMIFERNHIILQSKLNDYQTMMNENRRKNYLYSLTWGETLRSTENFSKYLNEKNYRKKAGIKNEHLK